MTNEILTDEEHLEHASNYLNRTKEAPTTTISVNTNKHKTTTSAKKATLFNSYST